MQTSLPKITIVTPSFNQGKYLEQTILSVIGQGYPNLEYIIIDGGSTDNSVEIIKKYEKHLAYWVSEKDNGQAHAINKGFSKATGSVLGWLNSDDMYLPGALNFIAENLKPENPEIFAGNCVHIQFENKKLTATGSNVPFYTSVNLETADYIIQPSSFWSKKVWDTIGELREDLNYGFDWEWFLRAKKHKTKFTLVENALSVYRIHSEHKTGNGGSQRQKELLKIYMMYNPFYARLYELLINEEGFDVRSIKHRFIVRLFILRKKKISYATLLKYYKPKKYKDYSIEEIGYVKTMVGKK